MAAGRPVVVVNTEQWESEGGLIPASMACHTVEDICDPLPTTACERLELLPRYQENQDPRGTDCTVTVDARRGVSTGISAADRAPTIRLPADPGTVASDLSRLGHAVPLLGVRRRSGHTEATLGPALLAGCRPAGVLCELMNDDGTLKCLPDLRAFADEFDLPLIGVAQLSDYRRNMDGAAGPTRAHPVGMTLKAAR